MHPRPAQQATAKGNCRLEHTQDSRCFLSYCHGDGDESLWFGGPDPAPPAGQRRHGHWAVRSPDAGSSRRRSSSNANLCAVTSSICPDSDWVAAAACHGGSDSDDSGSVGLRLQETDLEFALPLLVLQLQVTCHQTTVAVRLGGPAESARLRLQVALQTSITVTSESEVRIQAACSDSGCQVKKSLFTSNLMLDLEPGPGSGTASERLAESD